MSAQTAAPRRRLMLLRHAKAEPTGPGRGDFERALAAEGRNDATRIGAAMAARGLRPDRILISPARRTRETWDLVGAALGDGAAAEHVADLYEAAAPAVVALLRSAGEDARALLVVGHNPSIAELAGRLLRPDDMEAQARLVGFPTAALAVLDFAAASWREIGPGAARLVAFLDPRRLGAEAG